MSGLPALFLALVFLLTACSSKPKRFDASAGSMEASVDSQEEAQAGDYQDMAMGAPAMAPRPAPMQKSSRSLKSLMAMEASAPASAPEAPSQPQPPVQQAPRPSSKRMVHYSGYATLRSTEPERVLDSAIALVKAGGGYLENRHPGFAALRVPAQDFDSMFVRLMRLAQVIAYSQQAEDITSQFQDTEMRLKVVVSTLERLEELVKKARTESQKLRLLRELKRFREEREILEARKRELAQRARFASIHLHVETHAPFAGNQPWGNDIRDFLWIHRLNPFQDHRFAGRSSLKFSAPEGMVVSRKRKPWRATSSQGSEFWGSKLAVEPRGDSRFWAEAIKSRLDNGFKAADTQSVGGFRFCAFKSFGPTPYFYWVGVRSRGKKIELAEFYFPNEEQQAKLLPGLLAVVGRKD